MRREKLLYGYFVNFWSDVDLKRIRVHDITQNVGVYSVAQLFHSFT